MKLYHKCKDWLIGDYLSKQQDIYQQSKAILLFNASFLVFLVLVPLIIYVLCAGLYGKAFPSILGLVFVVVQVLVFKRYQSIWWSSFVLCMLTSAIVCVNINFNDQALHLVEPFWMIVIVVFAVFMIGVKWGTFICLFLLTGFSFFVVNKLESNLRDFLDSIPTIRYFLVAEIAGALIVLIYILSIFVSTTRKAEHALKTGNWLLEENNILVKKQNSEITVLLKEIHHRVKNNLQVVNSLLRLQSVQIHDEASQRVFEDAQYRIKAIALIHERMYKSPDLSNIDCATYFKGLAEDLLRQNSIHEQIELKMDVDLTEWKQDVVVPLGLLLNELIANSVEHGQLGENGVITIRLVSSGIQQFTLAYTDNGIGFPDELAHGFGLELIETLCEQLSGKMELINHPGQGVEYLFLFEG